MRFILPVLAVVLATPAGAAILGPAGVAAALPDPATAAILFAGLGLVAGARRARSNERAD